MKNTMTRVAVALLLLASVALLGCGDDRPTVTTDSGTMTRIDPPGLYDDGSGGSRAVGILDYLEIEGGFWAVTGVASSEGAESTVIAVIANAEAVESQLTNLRGHYVEVTGTVSDGASTRMAGPELTAQDIQVLEGTAEEVDDEL